MLQTLCRFCAWRDLLSLSKKAESQRKFVFVPFEEAGFRLRNSQDGSDLRDRVPGREEEDEWEEGGETMEIVSEALFKSMHHDWKQNKVVTWGISSRSADR